MDRIKARRCNKSSADDEGSSDSDDYSDGDEVFVSDTDSEIAEMAEEGSTDEDEFNLGETREPVGAPEIRTMARYLGRQPEWDGRTSAKRICWDQFYEQVSEAHHS